MKPTAPVTIQDISDDDDDEDKTAGGDGDEKKEEEDYDQNMIISLSLGSSDEDYDADKTVSEVNKADGTLKRGNNTTYICLCFHRNIIKILNIVSLFYQEVLRKGYVLNPLVIRKCILMIPRTLALLQRRRRVGVCW